MYGIYGPFPGFARLETYPGSKWTDAKLDCAPCYMHGHKPCQNNAGGYPKCFDQINIDLLVKDILSYYNK